MPAYYFHIWDDGVLIRDPDGLELPDIDAVRERVKNSIVSVLQEEDLDDLSAERAFQIEDDLGRTVLKVPFRLALFLRPVARRSNGLEEPLVASECVHEVCACRSD